MGLKKRAKLEPVIEKPVISVIVERGGEAVLRDLGMTTLTGIR